MVSRHLIENGGPWGTGWGCFGVPIFWGTYFKVALKCVGVSVRIG